MGAVAAVAYETLPFMKEKIAGQYEETIESATGAELTRMGNFLFDAEFISKRPLLGWSPRHSVRALLNPYVMDFVTGQGNGLTGFAVKFGLVGLALVGSCTFVLFRRLHGNALLAGVAVSVLAIGRSA